jgi:hypothetical protein
MKALATRATLTAAWLEAATHVAHSPGGRVQHLVLTVAQPSAQSNPVVIRALDAMLTPAHHSVETVANTIFPGSLYAATGAPWTPSMPAEDAAALDQAAADLYESYQLMLPLIRAADPGNAHGTYFSRMISWPGVEPAGYNQLDVRIRQLRAKRRHARTFNAADLAIEGAAELHDDGGVQIYKARDERTMGFPCLVHLDISVLNGKLSLLAVYRHWHLMRKAYGNLVGLAGLQAFLAQQSGFDIGELVVHGTVANAEQDSFGVRAVRSFLDDLAGAVTAMDQSVVPLTPAIGG